MRDLPEAYRARAVAAVAKFYSTVGDAVKAAFEELDAEIDTASAALDIAMAERLRQFAGESSETPHAAEALADAQRASYVRGEMGMTAQDRAETTLMRPAVIIIEKDVTTGASIITVKTEGEAET